MPKDGVFPALADPTRRRILELLSEGEMSAGEIAEQFPITFSSVSHHLTILRSSALVSTRREGQTIYYRLDSTVIQDLVRYFMKTFSGKTNA
jgi:ArsR family transcriptional regulator, arsenate/arsenite/antimonite-responsive transcriptional repressor